MTKPLLLERQQHLERSKQLDKQNRWKEHEAAWKAYLSIDVPSMRGTCRALCAGVDAGIIALEVQLPRQPDVMGVLQLGRFPSLAQLTLKEPHVAASYYTSYTPMEPAGAEGAAADSGSGGSSSGSARDSPQPAAATSIIDLGGIPQHLQKLHVSADYGSGRLAPLVLPPSPLPHLHVLELQKMQTQTKLDLATFPGLEQLVLNACTKLTRLLNLGSCTGLHDLDLRNCTTLADGLDTQQLQQLTKLQQLDIQGAVIQELDLSPVGSTLRASGPSG